MSPLIADWRRVGVVDDVDGKAFVAACVAPLGADAAAAAAAAAAAVVVVVVVVVDDVVVVDEEPFGVVVEKHVARAVDDERQGVTQRLGPLRADGDVDAARVDGRVQLLHAHEPRRPRQLPSAARRTE